MLTHAETCRALRSEARAAPGDVAKNVAGDEKAGIHDARLAVRALEAEARIPRDGRARLRNEEPGAEDEPDSVAWDGSHGHVILDGAREELGLGLELQPQAESLVASDDRVPDQY